MTSLRVQMSRLENSLAKERRLREAAETELTRVKAALEATTDEREVAA